MKGIEVRIPAPCAADWEQMQPQARSRLCGECQTRVHDLSAMTEREAERFLHRNASNDALCLSFQYDDAGAIVFRPPAPVVPIARLLRMVPAAGLAATMAACTPTAPPARTSGTPTVTAPAIEGPRTQTGERSLLTHPRDAVPPTVARAIDPDEPCDGSESAQPPEPTISTPPPVVAAPPPIRRLAGKPMIRKTGKLAAF